MPATASAIYIEAMRQACAEARQWVGATSPNPPVGAAALDAEGRVIATAAHKRAGAAHAEASLIELCRQQNILSQAKTLCVTLEPCNHYGKTPPCCEAIIASGIRRVVVGTHDPNPNVKGGGNDRLRAEGIEVITGVGEEECKQLMHAFAYRISTGKPFVSVKRAFDNQGSMIPPTGQKTFTSPESLHFAHRLRKKADAILTGSGTILADEPLFTVRQVADYPDKRRWLGILDRRHRVPQDYIDGAKTRGLDVVIYNDIAEAMADLTQKNVQDILVEAGPTLSASVLKADFWCLSTDIHQGSTDRIETACNKSLPVPFNPDALNWDYLLPSDAPILNVKTAVRAG
jgi:diaminohydroxyphosphoribosylaminopyrimidine deaminase/5-amino-6-(5-phosphoribosylamino)uracil reductase